MAAEPRSGPKFLNLGAGWNWSRSGWLTIDHKEALFAPPPNAWQTRLPGESLDIVFTSHMLEHIPHFKIDAVLKECNRILRPGGLIRILCPDLNKIARAYVEEDETTFQRLCVEDPTIRTDLGLGGRLMNFLISPGSDNFMFSRNGDFIGGYAHVYAYDFTMMKTLLERHGFSEVAMPGFCESRSPELREPLHPNKSPPTWTDERLWDLGDGITGFDRDPISSLIVEAIKTRPDVSECFEFGARGIRGLDPAQITWGALVRAFLSLVSHKIRSAPRDFILGFRLFLNPRSRLFALLKARLPGNFRRAIRLFSGR